jgi:hypothetical protein
MIGKRIDGPYTVIGNEAAQDSSLSWKARGLLVYLLSLPRDWNIRLSELARHATDGIDSTRKAMDELLNAGYIQRGARIRKPDGKLGDYVYLVTGVRDDLPEKIGKTYVGKTYVGKTYVGKTYAGKSNATK